MREESGAAQQLLYSLMQTIQDMKNNLAVLGDDKTYKHPNMAIGM